MIKFRCPSCAQKIGVDKKYAGKQANCSKCKQPMLIPSANEETSVGSTVIEVTESNILDSGIESKASDDNLSEEQSTEERSNNGPLRLTDEQKQAEEEP
jgi:transcription elongation factor Elf1